MFTTFVQFTKSTSEIKTFELLKLNMSGTQHFILRQTISNTLSAGLAYGRTEPISAFHRPRRSRGNYEYPYICFCSSTQVTLRCYL